MANRKPDPPETGQTLDTTLWAFDNGDGEPSLEAEALIADVVRPENERTTVSGVIARGGMGVVEEVVDSGLQRRAARKVLPPERRNDLQSVRLFVREAQITSHLDHPSIVPVHSIGLDEGDLHFTMKLVEGRTLSDIVAELPTGRLNRNRLFELLQIVVKVCEAVSLAHSRGVLHCDIKPENIMVGSFGEVYLMDWGIARLKQEHEPGSASPWRFAPGVDDTSVVGTIAYMSPEQACADASALSERTDVFGLGATLFEVLTGRPPYHDLSYSLAMSRARRAQFSPPQEAAPERDLPPALAEIVVRSTAFAPEERIASAAELRAELTAFMHGEASFPSVDFDPGAVIVTEGETGDAAYIIVSGECGVYRGTGPQRVCLRRIGPGDVFGETALLSPGPRTASVLAETAVRAQLVTGETFAGELNAMRPWMGRFVRTLADRFRESQHTTQAPAASADPTGHQDDVSRTLLDILMLARTFGQSRGPHLSLDWDRLPRALRVRLQPPNAALRAALGSRADIAFDDEKRLIRLRDWRRLAADLARSILD